MKPALKLDPDATYQTVENAIQMQAQVVLDSRAFPDATINGFLISGDAAALLVEVTGELVVPVERILGARCEARLFCEQHYQFSTIVRVAPQWGNSRSLAIVRPKIISVVDRRKFLRATLAPSSKIQLEWEHEGATHRHVAAMLNISPEGVACRVKDEVAAAFEANHRIQVDFEFPGLDHQFRLTAELCNNTPASNGYAILGLHFARAPEIADELALLRKTMEAPQTITANTEVCA